MGTGLEILAWSALATSAIGTGVSVYQGEKQREQVDNEAGRAAARAQDQKNAAEKLKADALAKEEQIRTRDAQAARRRIAGMGAQGRAGTILTGPQGVQPSASAAPGTGTKTILGA